MGNTLGGKKSAKVMKINGETFKFKTPVRAEEVVKDHPGLVLLDSEAVKHFGVRAKPLEAWQELKPKRLYFLVELPSSREERGPRRVQSGINMSAKDRLESLMLARRSASDLTIIRPGTIVPEEIEKRTTENGTMRLRMRLPKAEVDKLMKESKDDAEAAEKIMNLCMAAQAPGNCHSGGGAQADVHRKGGHGRVREGLKVREKRVGFLPFTEGEIQLAVAS
ncbi:hypothetical protein NMG60_11020613 [Bertholletia excelsa]